MSSEKSPAFQFYPKDFLTDEHVQLMSHQERGIYVTLLCLCWLEGSLPADVRQLAKLVSVPLPQFTRLWRAGIAACFMNDVDGRVKHARLDEEREKQESFRGRQSDRGKSSAASRKASAKPPIEVNHGSTGRRSTEPQRPPVQREVNSSISYLLSSTPVREKEPPPSARSNHPAFRGQKILVFDWMVEDLMRMLDPHGEVFDLHEWFFTLDKRCVDRGDVPPDRDGGVWLKSVTLTEAMRRGLPLRAVSAEKPTDDDVWAAIAKKGPSVRG